jgi:hypothetical protein
MYLLYRHTWYQQYNPTTVALVKTITAKKIMSAQLVLAFDPDFYDEPQNIHF